MYKNQERKKEFRKTKTKEKKRKPIGKSNRSKRT